MQKNGLKESFKIVNILFGETDNFMSELQLVEKMGWIGGMGRAD